MPETEDDVLRARRLVLGLSTLCLALLAVLAWSLMRPRANQSSTAELLADPVLRQAVVADLVQRAGDVYDSHPDPDVGRVLLPNLRGRTFLGASLSSNEFGMREKSYSLPKPDGVLRVVVLGDSFVFGYGVEAEDRCGTLLERYLRERRRAGPESIECLHLAIGGWNVLAECAYLRRQLADLQPDLVLHVTVANDLDDNDGVRGFGASSRFSPRHGERADARLTEYHPVSMGFQAGNFLDHGLDHEARERLSEAGAALRDLADAVERGGGDYVLVAHWGGLNRIPEEHWAPLLAREQVAYVSPAFGEDRELWVSAEDAHWNPRGHERIARFLFGLIAARGLLPQLSLETWPEAAALAAEWEAAGLAPSLAPSPYDAIARSATLGRTADFRRLEQETAMMVHGGIDAEGLVSPFASLMLAHGDEDRLRLAGACLDRHELDGKRLRVFLEEVELEPIELRRAQPIDRTWALPPAASGRRFLTLRLMADDYVYAGPDLQHCVSFRLERVALERGP